jgi:hypothetical protein
MKLIKKIRKLCTPAYVYLVISVIAILAMMLQNGGNNKHFCIGEYGCDVESKGAIFIGQGLYTAFWVFVLDSICKSGHKNISWFLVLLPYILMFIGLGMIVLGGKHRESFVEGMAGGKGGKTDGTKDGTKGGTKDDKDDKCSPLYHKNGHNYRDSTCQDQI